METRAHHLLIGGFVVLLMGALIAFLLWIAKIDLDKVFVEYDIYFAESVAGLTRGGDVRFNGIRVGEVRQIDIAPENPRLVLVTVRIEIGVPVLEDSVAVLALQGLTGVAFVQVEGGSPGAQPLVAKDGEERAVIPSRVSPLQEFFTGAPDLISSALSAIANLNELLSEENRAHFAGILSNVDDLSSTFAQQRSEYAAALSDVRLAITELRGAIGEIGTLAKAATGFVTDDVRPAVAQLQKSIVAAETLMNKLTEVVEENRSGVASFTNNALPELTRLITDARRAAIALARLAEQLEENPGELVFKPKKPEFDPN